MTGLKTKFIRVDEKFDPEREEVWVVSVYGGDDKDVAQAFHDPALHCVRVTVRREPPLFRVAGVVSDGKMLSWQLLDANDDIAAKHKEFLESFTDLLMPDQ